MLAIIPSATLLGVEGRPVSVEVHVSNVLSRWCEVSMTYVETLSSALRPRPRAVICSAS